MKALRFYTLGVWMIGFGMGLIVASLCGCGLDSIEPSGNNGVCEQLKAKFNATDCGTVYQFPIPAQTPSGFFEFCIPDHDGLRELAEQDFGPSIPTPRFPTPRGITVVDCAHQCPSRTGCNSYVDKIRDLGGCYCPGFKNSTPPSQR